MKQAGNKSIITSLHQITLSNRTVFIFLFLVGVIVYQNSLTVPFQFDDIWYLKENPRIKTFSALWESFTSSYTAFFDSRTFLVLTFFLNYKLGGLDVFGYHLVNIIFHILNAFLIYLLFRSYASPDIEKSISWKYVLAAVFFLVHPINTESVTYLTSRSSVFSLFFILGSMLCFFRGTGKGLHKGYYVASVLCFFLALASKRTGIVLVPLLLLFDYFYCAKDGKALWTRLRYHVPFLAVPLLMSVVLFRYIESYAGHHPWLENSLTELRVIVQYGKLLFLPLGLNIDHDVQASSFLDGAVVFSTICIAALVAVAILVRKKVPGISFGIYWYLLALAPFLVIRVEGFMAERWVYTASIGFSVVISELVAFGAQKYRKTAAGAAVVWIILLGAATIARNEVYASPVRLWEDAAQKSPEKPRAHLNLGRAYIETGNTAQAVEKIHAGLKIGQERGLKKSETVAAYINLAAAYGNDNQKVQEVLEAAEPLAAEYHEYYHSLGLLHIRTGQYQKAIIAFQKALELLPNSPTLLNQIGNVYDGLQQSKKAKEYYLLSINGICRNGLDYVNQGEAYLKLGDPGKRLASYYEAVRVDPFDISIRNGLGEILFSAGYLEEGWKQFDMALKISPHSAKAYIGMGTILLAEYRYGDAEKYFIKALDLTPSSAVAERQNLLRIVDEVHRRAL